MYTGLSGEPTVGRANGRPRDRRATRGLANGRKEAPDMSGAPDLQRSATVDCSVYGNKSGTGQCPVCTGLSGAQTTEGKICLPRLLSTAPSCLGAIKGTPRRMEEQTKHSLSTLDHSHSILAHLFDILVT